MSLSNLNELKELREQVKELITSKNKIDEEDKDFEDTKFQYQFWLKRLTADGKLEYKKVKKNGEIVMSFLTHEEDTSIDREIERQNEANELANAFASLTDDILTNRYILEFFCNTDDLHTAMDPDIVFDKLNTLNRDYGKKYDYDEAYIYNSMICFKQFGYIPEELLKNISQYLIETERKSNRGKY